MAAVRFAFGQKPALNEHDAMDLAELLSKRRTLASTSLAGKLRTQARVPEGRTSEDIELDRGELDALADALADEPWAQEQEWFTFMRAEVAAARATTP
jgi:hypothetical protein